METLTYKLEPINVIEIAEALKIDDSIDVLELEVPYSYEGAYDGGRDEPSYPAYIEIGEIKAISYTTFEGITNPIPEELSNDIALLITVQELEQIEAVCMEQYVEEVDNDALDQMIADLDTSWDMYQ